MLKPSQVLLALLQSSSSEKTHSLRALALGNEEQEKRAADLVFFDVLWVWEKEECAALRFDSTSAPPLPVLPDAFSDLHDRLSAGKHWAVSDRRAHGDLWTQRSSTRFIVRTANNFPAARLGAHVQAAQAHLGPTASTGTGRAGLQPPTCSAAALLATLPLPTAQLTIDMLVRCIQLRVAQCSSEVVPTLLHSAPFRHVCASICETMETLELWLSLQLFLFWLSSQLLPCAADSGGSGAEAASLRKLHAMLSNGGSAPQGLVVAAVHVLNRHRKRNSIDKPAQKTFTPGGHRSLFALLCVCVCCLCSVLLPSVKKLELTNTHVAEKLQELQISRSVIQFALSVGQTLPPQQRMSSSDFRRHLDVALDRCIEFILTMQAQASAGVVATGGGFEELVCRTLLRTWLRLAGGVLPTTTGEDTEMHDDEASCQPDKSSSLTMILTELNIPASELDKLSQLTLLSFTGAARSTGHRSSATTAAEHLLVFLALLLLRIAGGALGSRCDIAIMLRQLNILAQEDGGQGKDVQMLAAILLGQNRHISRKSRRKFVKLLTRLLRCV